MQQILPQGTKTLFSFITLTVNTSNPVNVLRDVVILRLSLFFNESNFSQSWEINISAGQIACVP